MYNYNMMDQSLFTGIAAGLIGLLIFVLIICIVILVLKVVGTWKILTKAGKPGWGALIPVYNTYLLCQITGVNPWWIVIVIGSSLLGFIPVIGSLATTAAAIYFTVLLNVSLARSFDKEDGFAVGLILLPPVFYLILGCGKDKYVAAKPMNDIIFKDNNIDITDDKKSTKSTKAVKYCSNCGKPVEKTTKFCSNCGKVIK